MEATVNTVVNKGGRPLKYTPDYMSRKLTEYLSKCETDKLPVTITGYCLYIDTNRQTLSEYADKDEFADIIKKVHQASEDFAASFLYSGKNPAGAIFYLKNLHGWADRQDINISSTLTMRLDDAQIEQLADAALSARQQRLAAKEVQAEVLDAKTEQI